ncbi:hypothetical protein P8452_43686 [Trifolium repens]|nr:B3 domain-containing transcription factor VRN1 [Trifolium repens]WJX58208.1 hypothetical protein P8452_43686 [Trifolium repens]
MQPRQPSELPEKESKHFMKAILPSPIHAKQIRIPDEFITRFGNELKNVATIVVPDGCVWEMELKKCDECTNEEPNTKYDSPRKRSKVETSESCGKKTESMSKDASKRAKDAANEFNPNNPHFCSKIVIRRFVHVQGDFARKYLKPNVHIKLQNSYGEQWEVYCILHGARWYNMEISKGFSKFQGDNNLSHGDYCVFELIKNNLVVLKVTMFRAVDYRD